MIILCADDFGLTHGVSRAIGELARVRHLSATSAIVTLPDWPEHADACRALRADVATGLHVNLTLGRPLSSVSGLPLKPNGDFPSVGSLVWSALARRLDNGALREEISTQISQFHETCGVLPDFIDGHQHVHALPVVRRALIAAMGSFDWRLPPLVRVPTIAWSSVAALPAARRKAMLISALSAGLRRELRDSAFLSNDTFGGFSDFAKGSDYRPELEAAFKQAGRCHIVMCHPGRADAALAAVDPVVQRREEEFNAIAHFDELPDRIWHPVRHSADETIDWQAACR